MTPLYVTGIDGSHASQAALSFARGLAGLTGADLLAVNVYNKLPRVGVRGVAMPGADLVDGDVRTAAHAVVDRVAPADMRRGILPASSPAEGLHRIAEDEDAAMLVVGRTHEPEVIRRTFGGVGEQLLRGAPCPVAVVPAAELGAPAMVGVAYDASPEAETALRFGADLARATGMGLLLVGVMEPGPVATSLESTAETLRAGGLAATARVVQGDAAEQLAAVDDVDLLVTGSRGFGPLRATIAGSVSSRLVAQAKVPVVIVPREAPAEALEAVESVGGGVAKQS